MTHHFPDPLRTELYGFRGPSTVEVLTHRFSYASPHHPIIIAPPGTLTDGASVPKVFWNILNPRGRYGRAAVIHDFLYSLLGGRLYPQITRKEADWIFKSAVKDCGCGWWTTSVMFRAVRLFGWKSFRKPEAHIERI